MTAEKFAKENGFSSARKIPSWNGCTCYEAIYSGVGLNDVPTIGLPQIILENEDGFRMASENETFRYMDETDIAEDDGG